MSQMLKKEIMLALFQNNVKLQGKSTMSNGYFSDILSPVTERFPTVGISKAKRSSDAQLRIVPAAYSTGKKYVN